MGGRSMTAITVHLRRAEMPRFKIFPEGAEPSGVDFVTVEYDSRDTALVLIINSRETARALKDVAALAEVTLPEKIGDQA